MINDFRYAFRVIRKHPLSNAVIVFTIGALVAVIGSWYGTFRSMDLRQMPFDEPDRLVRFWRTSKVATTDQYPYDIYREIKAKAQSFEQLGALTAYNTYTLVGAGEPVHLRAVRCSAEVLDITGLKPVIGRFFTKTDEEPGNRQVVVLAEHVWRKNFQARKDILGDVISLNGAAYTVIGVAPEPLADSHLARSADLWKPETWKIYSTRADFVTVVGRVKPGIAMEKAQAELDAIVAPLEAVRPFTEHEKDLFKEAFTGVKIAKLNRFLHRRGRPNNQQLYVNIFASVLLASVVLIACFNMTSLFLVQSTARAREFAVRLSVGAGRWRIVRLMLMESLVLSAAGGALGCMVVLVTNRLGASQNVHLAFDPGLYAVALGMAAVIGALVSIVPALRSGRTDLSVALKDGGQSSASRHRHRLRNFLVGAQVAMATLLTVTAVLFSSAFVKTIFSSVSFDADRVVSIEVKLDRERHKKAEQVSTYARRALKSIQAMPGVERASVCSPGIGANWHMSRNVQWIDKTREYPDRRTGIVQTSPDVFESLGQNLIHGRYFSPGNDVLHEAMVNREFLRKFAPRRNPVGEQFRLGGMGEQVFTIVGVLENRSPKLDHRGEQPETYLSHRHPIQSSHRLGFLVETKADAGAFGLAVRENILRLDSLQPVGPAILLADIIEKNVRPIRIACIVILGMAGFGLCMSLMGVYGVVAYSVIQRTREMGIRMALGATRARIVRTVMSEGTRLLLFGGIPASIVAVLAIRALPLHELPGMDANDPTLYAIGILLVAITGTLAALLPAIRMIKLNPSHALRHE